MVLFWTVQDPTTLTEGNNDSTAPMCDLIYIEKY
jgi:hypothetical protein